MKLGFAGWIDDPDPPDDMSDADIERMAQRYAIWLKKQKSKELNGDVACSPEKGSGGR